MEVKGTAVKSIKEFVETRFKADYQKWLKAMPEESQAIINGGIFANNWYPMKAAAVEQPKHLARFFTTMILNKQHGNREDIVLKLD